jgi:hypothetical protein
MNRKQIAGKKRLCTRISRAVTEHLYRLKLNK